MIQTTKIVNAFAKIGQLQLVAREQIIRSLQANIDEYTRNLERRWTALEQENALLTAEKAKWEASKDTVKKDALRFVKMTRKHTLIESVTVTANTIQVTTRLLFANIRKEAGSDVKRRTCLGAYRICIPLNPHDTVSIEALVFSNDHWSISRNIPCLGDWQIELHNYREKHDFYGVIDMFTRYLRASDDDGSAYLRSHVWRKDRVAKASLKKGDYVVVTHPDPTFLGRVAIVTDVSSIILVTNKAGSHWQWSPSNLRKISKEQYESGDTIAIPKDTRLAKVDRLPEGALAKDALKLLK